MTIYEQIQQAIDHIEKHLPERLLLGEVSSGAAMSTRSFQNWFLAVTGLSFKEYVVKRRLSAALGKLSEGNETVLDIALDAGYRSHESFTRAFRSEFGLSPTEYRRQRTGRAGFARIVLYKEMYMGVIVKELPELLCVSFDGFGESPEDKAGNLMRSWCSAHPSAKQRRIFGHNIDLDGNPDSNPKNVGYRFLVNIENAGEADGAAIGTMAAGRFVVTGIEGSFSDDPTGAWVTTGWNRMNEMMERKGYRAKRQGRWYEEELEPRTAGNMRLDLYLEIEEEA